MANVVLRGFTRRSVLPRIDSAVRQVSLFGGLNSEQVHRLAGVCSTKTSAPGEHIFAEGENGKVMLVVLEGEAAIYVAGKRQPVGRVGPGESLGEMSLLTGAGHSATALASTAVEVATLSHHDLAELVRLRPDIGALIYKNLAVGLGQKLKRSDLALAFQK